MIRLNFVLAVVFAFGESCIAAVFHSNFENDPVGSTPAGWSITGAGSTGSVVTDVTAAEGQQSLLLTNSVSFDNTAARADFANTTSGILLLRGFARVEQTDVGITPFGLITASNFRANVLTFGSDGTFRYVDGNSAFSTGENYNAGEWYRFEQTVNMDSARWSFAIFDSSDSPVASENNLVFDDIVGLVNQIRSLAGVAPPTVSWYIDDVSLSVVPEPGSIVPVIMALTVLTGRCRRLRANESGRQTVSVSV